MPGKLVAATDLITVLGYFCFKVASTAVSFRTSPAAKAEPANKAVAKMEVISLVVFINQSYV